jgi:hypothetical protein
MPERDKIMGKIELTSKFIEVMEQKKWVRIDHLYTCMCFIVENEEIYKEKGVELSLSIDETSFYLRFEGLFDVNCGGSITYLIDNSEPLSGKLQLWTSQVLGLFELPRVLMLEEDYQTNMNVEEILERIREIPL